MSAPNRSSGRVTPKGVRPAGTTSRDGRSGRSGSTFDRAGVRQAPPKLDRRVAARATVVRTGHRGGR